MKQDVAFPLIERWRGPLVRFPPQKFLGLGVAFRLIEWPWLIRAPPVRSGRRLSIQSCGACRAKIWVSGYANPLHPGGITIPQVVRPRL
jgi:hypothetical protein